MKSPTPWLLAPSQPPAAHYNYERLAVRGVEIPNALRLAWTTGDYAGSLALGCVIRGETDHYDHICREVSRKHGSNR